MKTKAYEMLHQVQAESGSDIADLIKNNKELAIGLAIVGLIFVLADALVKSADIINQLVPIVQETPLNTAVNNAEVAEIFSWIKNNADLCTANVPINAQLNLNDIQFFIIHSNCQSINLATVNADHSLNIHEQALVNEATSATELDNITDRFINAFDSLIQNIPGPISIQATIITKPDTLFWFTTVPFIPLLDILTEHTFSLSASVHNIPNASLHLLNVGQDLETLDLFSNQLVTQTGWLNNLLTLVFSTNSDAQPPWSYYQAHGQLLRYIVQIRNAYFIMG